MDINKVNNIQNSLGTAKLIAVTKNQDIEAVKLLFDNGYTEFGENKLQELIKKKEILPNANWHFIGRIQSNKIKQIVHHSVLIHSVSEFRYLQKINDEAGKINKIQDVLLQLNIANEVTKKGLSKDDLELIINSNFNNVRICGMMVMGDHTDDQVKIEATFKTAKTEFDQLQSKFENFNILSMGMSSDYELAIKCGSNMVRIGTLLFKD